MATTSLTKKQDPYHHLKISLNPDGTITRHHTSPTIQPNPIASRGDDVVSKDLTLNSQNKTSIRIYRPTKLPSNDNVVARLPIVVYFHGGGFIHLSASSNGPHYSCSQLSSEVPSIVVSVDYRLAPEYRIPVQYHDALEAILWVKQQGLVSNGEEWVGNYGDFSRCYICGSDSGANIAFNVALRVLDLGLDLTPLQVYGLVLNQPMFGRTQREEDQELWNLVLPIGMGHESQDHCYCDPTSDQIERIREVGSGWRWLVVGSTNENGVDRIREFVTRLVGCELEVQARFISDVGLNINDVMEERWDNSILNIVKDFVI